MKNLVQVCIDFRKLSNPQLYSLSLRIFSSREFKSTEGFFKYIYIFYFGTILDFQENCEAST